MRNYTLNVYVNLPVDQEALVDTARDTVALESWQEQV